MADLTAFLDDPLVAKVEKFAVRHRLFGRKILAAVSGGPDSVAMLHVLACLSGRHGFELAVAHLDHGFREESAEEGAFVEDMATSLGLECRRGKVDVPLLIRREGGSPQSTARKVRYRFLKEVAGEEKADRVALAQHLDDQAETVLMRLLRGTGPEGLSGMLPIRDSFYIRPMLEVKRSEILEFLDAHGIPYREDASNLKPVYLRNQMRLELIPHVERTFNPRFSEGLYRLSRLMAAENSFMEERTREFISESRLAAPAGVTLIKKSVFSSWPPAIQRRALRYLLAAYELGMEGLDELVDKAKAPEPDSITVKGYNLNIGRELLAFSDDRTIKSLKRATWTIGEEGRTNLPELGFSFICTTQEPPADPRGGPLTVFLDKSAIDGEIKVRTRREGDRFTPYGLGGTKKLSRYLSDAKADQALRDLIPVLTIGGRIAWVVGFRTDDRFKITPATKKVLRIEAKPL